MEGLKTKEKVEGNRRKAKKGEKRRKDRENSYIISDDYKILLLALQFYFVAPPLLIRG